MPVARHSSQPPGVRGETGRTRVRCGSGATAALALPLFPPLRQVSRLAAAAARLRRSSGQTLPLIDPSREFEDIYSRMGQLLDLAFWDVGIGLAGAPGLWRNDEVAFHGGDSGGGGGCGPGGAGLFE